MLNATLELTPAGLLAVGGLVTSILLGSAVIVAVATSNRPPAGLTADHG